MNPNKSLPSDFCVQDIRNNAVSRRGGVRVRGGRLPPIRVPNLPQASNSKKVVVPNIPQRRRKVKEDVDSSEQFTKPKQNERRGENAGARNRGRGRGNQVFIQTEGSFLEQGPAARVKTESSDSSYERISVPRSSKSGTKLVSAFDQKPDEKDIKLLLEHYDDEPFHEYDGLLPARLPFPKLEFKQNIKKELYDETNGKLKIKEEPYDEDDVKPNIKEESAENKWNSLEGKIFSKIKTEISKNEDYILDLNNSVKITGDSALLLFQFPRCLPFNNNEESSTEDSELSDSKEKEKCQDNTASSFFSVMNEGCIGKLQVLKSGKMRLVLGSLVFKLEAGTNSETLMEPVSIRVKDNKEGDLIALGKVDRKMVFRPSSAMLLEEDVVVSKS